MMFGIVVVARAATFGEVGGPSSFVGLMRHYVEDYTNAHDLDVCDRIFHPDYRIHIGGATLGYGEYEAMVRDAFSRFPDLGLVVHGFVTNGDRLAMHFSEHATSPAHGNRRAVWEGIGLYRRGPDGRLVENFVEQDFYGRRQQLASGEPVHLPDQDPEVWITPDVPASSATDDAARTWLEARSGADLEKIPVRGPVTATDLFSAGDRFAARLSIRGRLEGDLYGVPREQQGREVAVDAVAIGRVRAGEVRGLRLIGDRFGLQQRLKT
jgi:predicted ester cyclase